VLTGTIDLRISARRFDARLQRGVLLAQDFQHFGPAASM